MRAQDFVQALRPDARGFLDRWQVLRGGSAADLPIGPGRNCGLVDHAIVGARVDAGRLAPLLGEKKRLEELGAMFPRSKGAIDKVLRRVVDLLPLTREHYYHPAMKGSWSLKAVLPTIDPSLNYAELGEIQEGGMAQLAYLEAIAPQTSTARQAELEHALLDYCGRDTEALVRVARFLQTGK